MRCCATALVGIFVLSTSAFAQEPWLPKEEQNRLKSLWPKGVPFPDNLKFYKLPLAQQQLKILNDQPYFAFHLVDIRIEKEIWTSPGGLHNAPRTEWKNATGLSIPEGKKIKWWMGKRAIPSSGQRLDSLEWAFPVGTVAIDMLIRTKPQGDQVFEVRKREKLEKGWDSGVAYRPYASPPAGAALEEWWSILPPGTKDTLKLSNAKANYPIWVTKKVELTRIFVPSNIVVVDEVGTMPSRYKGVGIACSSCHNRSGEATDYGAGCISGKDTILSWRPNTEDTVTGGLFGKNPNIDGRWPIE